VNSWDDLKPFIDLLARTEPSGPSILFRGQSDHSWILRPSIARLGFNEEKTRNLEMASLSAFQAQAHQFLPLAALPGSRLDFLSWWILMQHYGAPTRLLDWTTSLYVATYFAVLTEPDKDGAVWSAQPRPVNDVTVRRYGDILNNHVLIAPTPEARLKFFWPLSETDRMSAQGTQFSVSTSTTADHAELIRTTESTEGSHFSRIVIPSELKMLFLRRLREMNLTARTLFPGIDGLGRSIAELLRLGADHALRQAPGTDAL
jgi:hypothetical protein